MNNNKTKYHFSFAALMYIRFRWRHNALSVHLLKTSGFIYILYASLSDTIFNIRL